VSSLRDQVAALESKAALAATRAAEAQASQKSEYEALLQSSQGFVEKVLNEKKELNAQVSALASQVESLSREYAAKEAAFRSAVLPAEIKKAKELWVAAERVARESFLAHRTKQIKAETVAALEPEVAKALQRERADRKDNEEALARRHAQALADARADHEALIASIRKQHATALEHAREEERVAAQRKAREIVERYDTQMQDMRARHTAELEAERTRAVAASSSLQGSIDAALMQARQDALVSAAKAAEAHRQELDDRERRHALALSQEREKTAIEKESWTSLMLAKLQREADAKVERATRAAAQSHEEEIGMLVARLGAENEKLVKDVVRDSERKLEQLKRSTATELAAAKRQTEQSDKALHALQREHAALDERARTAASRLAAAQTELAEQSSRLRAAEAKVGQLEAQVASARRDVSDTFAAEKSQLRAQFRSLQAQIDDGARKLAAAQADAAARQEAALSERDAAHAASVAAMQDRVKDLLGKKEGVIEALKRRVAEAEAEVQRVHQELHHLS